jgi:hypothetical protein
MVAIDHSNFLDRREFLLRGLDFFVNPPAVNQQDQLYTLRWWASKKVADQETRDAMISIIDGLLGEQAPPKPLVPLYPGPEFPVVGRPILADGIDAYVRSADPRWIRGITVHHTAAPSLAQRPSGFLETHMHNLRTYYKGLGWSAGPHFFVDEDQAWAFSPLTKPGIHAKSFNRTHIGIEMLGDYDREDPWSGRGLQVLTMTASIVAELLRSLNLDVSAVNFHREDPKSDKSCPGRRIEKTKFLQLVQA